MLEIRYLIATGELTAWNGDEKTFGRLDRGRATEEITIVDAPIPDEELRAWLFDGDKLIPNPNYVEPKPPRDLAQEIDTLRNENTEIKSKLKQAGIV